MRIANSLHIGALFIVVSVGVATADETAQSTPISPPRTSASYRHRISRLPALSFASSARAPLAAAKGL